MTVSQLIFPTNLFDEFCHCLHFNEATKTERISDFLEVTQLVKVRAGILSEVSRIPKSILLTNKLCCFMNCTFEHVLLLCVKENFYSYF